MAPSPQQRLRVAMSAAGAVVSARRGLQSHRLAATTNVSGARRGLQSHRVEVTAANSANVDAHYENISRQTRTSILAALVILVGVVQDLVAASGYNLSQLLYDDAVRRMGGQGRLLKAVSVGIPLVARAFATLNRSGPTRVVGAKALLGLQALLPAFKTYMGPDFIDPSKGVTLIRRLKPFVMAFLKRKPVDMRPVATALIMAMRPTALRALAQRHLRNLLNEYVYAAYVPTPGPGAMCQLCSSASGSCDKAKSSRNNGSHMAKLTRRTIQAINILLMVDGRGLTLTTAMQQAIKANITSRLSTALKWGAKLTGAQMGVLLQEITVALFPFFDRRLHAMGLKLEKPSFATFVRTHLSTLRAFLMGVRAMSIDNLLVDLVHVAKPLGILQGAVQSAVRGSSSSEFCALCKTAYPSCRA